MGSALRKYYVTSLCNLTTNFRKWQFVASTLSFKVVLYTINLKYGHECWCTDQRCSPIVLSPELRGGLETNLIALAAYN